MINIIKDIETAVERVLATTEGRPDRMTTQTFEVHQIGTTLYVPHVKRSDERVECPDCLGAKTWTVTTPAGNSFTVACPRCGGGDKDYLLPRRRIRTLEIQEVVVTAFEIKYGPHWQTKELEARVEYKTKPWIGTVLHDRSYTTPEAAQIAGEALLEGERVEDIEEWNKDRERDLKRAGQDIVAALREVAFEKYKELDAKLDKLREQMLEAISHPSLYGPKIHRPTYGGPEITHDAMEAWCCDLLDNAGLEGWTEAELHEAKCSC